MNYLLLIVLSLGLALGTVDARIGAGDISGTWSCSIDQKDEDGPMTVTFVLKQEGEKLTGTYSDSFNRHEVTGTVNGNKAVFSFEIKPPPNSKKTGSLTATFNGTIESPTKM